MRTMLAVLATAAAVTAQAYVPAASQPQLSELNSRLNYPLMRAASRMQVVLGPGELGSGASTLFRRVSFRYDGPSLGANGGTLANLEVRMAPAALAPAASSGVFAANLGASATSVLTTTSWAFPADGSPNPEEFGGTAGALALPFTTPFVYRGGGLVLEVIASGNTNAGSGVANCMLDAETEPLGGPQGGAATVNGTGCDGATLGASGQLAPGGQVALAATGLGQALPAVGVLGQSRTSWGSLPLPLDLGFLGAAGCALRNDWLLDRSGATTGGGTIPAFTPAFTWPVPADAALGGAVLQFQVLAAKTGANAAQLVTTNNVEVRLGTWRAPTRAYMTHFHHQDPNAAVAAFSAPIVPALRLD